MITAKVIGAGGYGGVGVTEFLIRHPYAKISALVDVENIGIPISTIYPHLLGFLDNKIVDPKSDEANQPTDVVFMATPDGVGMTLAEAELKRGSKVIDYSGDFRFNSQEAYCAYATRIGRDPVHKSPHLLSESVYGLPELHRKDINKKTKIVGNPGCFAVSCILGLAPAVKYGLVFPDSIICDCKTGVSGAGKKPSPTFHYPARYDQMNAYKLAGHQHVCEIERELSLVAEKKIVITFTAQVVPVCRGIMSTLYGTLTSEIEVSEVLDLYKKFHSNNIFVRVLDANSQVGTMHVRGTNYCNLVVSIDKPSRRLRVVSYIDNLVKGQAGSAIQNMNLLFGLDESAGLDRPGIYP